MFVFHQTKKLSTFIITISMLSVALAAPVDQHTSQSKTQITLSAEKIQPASNHLGSLLSGKVQVCVGNKIISADKVLVKYIDAKHHEIAEFTIYGKGILKDGKHSIRFINGVFNPANQQLTAEKITTTN